MFSTLSINEKVFLGFLTFRFLCVHVIKSSFVPDEYWQSLEVSHKFAFGYGHLTWEWDKGIRTCFYPFFIHLLYRIIPDFSCFVIYCPKVLQAILTTFGDFFAYKFASEYFGENCGLWTAFSISVSWFLSYCSCRTLSNMMEATFTSCGLYFYPWNLNQDYNYTKYLWFAGLSLIVRPTAFIPWFPLFLWHIWREHNPLSLLKYTILIGLACVTAMCLIDRWCYGNWVFPHYNFILLNWNDDIGAFYGTHKVWWYFVIGLPAVLGLQIILFFLGLCIPKLDQLTHLVFWFMLVLSVPSHKEFRFLLPILYLCLIICGVVLNEIWSGRMHVFGFKIPEMTAICMAVLLVFTNIPLFLYMGLVHQRGVIDATLYLSDTVDEKSDVLFLMPCHSTPYYSYIHKEIKLRFLACEPNFDNNRKHIDEADDFFAHPVQWLEKNYDLNNSSSLPTHIVMFDTLYQNISEFLEQHRYRSCYSAFHSHFPEKRTGKYVYIYCKLRGI